MIQPEDLVSIREAAERGPYTLRALRSLAYCEDDRGVPRGIFVRQHQPRRVWVHWPTFCRWLTGELVVDAPPPSAGSESGAPQQVAR